MFVFDVGIDYTDSTTVLGKKGLKIFYRHYSKL